MTKKIPIIPIIPNKPIIPNRPIKEKRLSDKDVDDILNTLDRAFKRMSKDEKKAILLHIGQGKVDIEKLDDTTMLRTIKSDYQRVLRNIDMNDVNSIDPKYKIANELMTKKDKLTKTKLKEKVQKYKEIKDGKIR
tara:strand:- start:4133 stop:4537 length:405 start_codon:yes stop_codon:yes gene_type:complete